MSGLQLNRSILLVLVCVAAVAWAGAAWSADDGGELGDGVLVDPYAPTVRHVVRAPSEDGSLLDSAAPGVGTSEEPMTKVQGAGPRPVWQFLSDLSPTERAAASIEIEPFSELGSTAAFRAAQAASLWNTGRTDEAAAILQGLEDAGASLGVAISWDPAAAPKLNSVQVGAHIAVQDQELVVDMTTGNQFDVVEHGDGAGESWTVYASFNGGATWTQTYQVYNSADMIHVSAAVAGDWLYVAYAGNPVSDEARIRRLDLDTGSVDAGYGFQIVFTDTYDVKEVELASSVDYSDNRLFYLSIQDDGFMIYYWTDQNGGVGALPWAYIAPGVTDADWGLDAVYTQDGGLGALFASFVAQDDDLNAWRRSAGVNDVHDFNVDALGDPPSISAYRSNAFIVYKDGGDAIRYRVSYNMGEAWVSGTIDSSGTNYEPRVTLRHGGGVVVVYEKDTDPDDILYMKRRSYPLSSWTDTMRCNDLDLAWGWPSSLARLKDGGYGVLTIGGGHTRYDEAPLLFANGFNIGDFGGWAVVNTD